MEKKAREDFLSEAVREIEGKRVSAKKSCLTAMICAAAFLAVSILFIALCLSWGFVGWMFAVASILFLAAIVSGASAGLVYHKYHSRAERLLDGLVDEKYYQNVKRNPKGGMPLPELLSTGFFAPPDRYLYENQKSGFYDGIPFYKSTYNLQAERVRSDGKHTYVEYVTYAAGTIYRFDFERKFQKEVRVIEGGGFYGKGKKVETEYIAFNRKFGTYSDDQQMVFYLLTPQMQEKIMAMEQSFKGHFALGFIGGNHLYVSINDAGASLDIPLFKAFDLAKAKKALNVLSFPVRVVDEFGLTGPKFRKNAGVEFSTPDPEPAKEDDADLIEKALDA